MPCDSIVRIATIRDYQEALRLFLQSHKENGLFTLSPKKMQWFLNRFLMPETIHPEDTGIRGVIGVIGQEGSLEALCGLCISDLWYTEDKHLADFLVFVDPEFRASNHAKSLVNWMKKQSDIIGLPLMSGIVSTVRTEAKCRMFRRLIPKVGEYFLYNSQSLTLGSSLATGRAH